MLISIISLHQKIMCWRNLCYYVCVCFKLGQCDYERISRWAPVDSSWIDNERWKVVYKIPPPPVVLLATGEWRLIGTACVLFFVSFFHFGCWKDWEKIIKRQKREREWNEMRRSARTIFLISFSSTTTKPKITQHKKTTKLLSKKWWISIICITTCKANTLSINK